MIALNFISFHDNEPEEMPPETVDLINERGLWTLDGAYLEFKQIYKERIPFQEVPMLDGQCYRWTDEFIHSCLLAMSTDRMVQFSIDELQAWRYFVNFENYHSTSARETDANGTAVGCTIPDTDNNSYVVGWKDGDYKITEEKCQPPGYEIEGEQIWKSLDKAFMALYNCEEINPCTNTIVMDDVSPCTT